MTRYLLAVRTWRVVLGVGALMVLLSGCWPAPGAGPDRRSHNAFERTLTPATVGRLTRVFRRPLADGAGPPVVTPTGLFVRTGLSLAAFEPDTGAPRWSVELPNADGLSFMSDPYVLDDRDQVLASVSNYRGGAIYDDDLVELNADTGAEEGRRPSQAGIGSLRNLEAGLIGTDYTDGFNATWLGVQPIDGAQRWGGLATEIRGGVISLGQQQLFVADGSQAFAYDTTVACPASDPTSPFPLLVCSSQWIRPVGGTATPVVIGDNATVYVGSDNGTFHALRSDTGGVRWTAQLGSPIRQAPALADGTLFVATANGRLSALPAKGCGASTCQAMWTTGIGSEIKVQPAVAGGVVYIGTHDGTVRAFATAGCGAATCPPLWTANVGVSITGGLAVYNGRLYVGTSDALVAFGLPAR